MLPRLMLLCALLATSARGAVAPITLDGAFDDWATLPPVVTDATGDDGSSGVDFHRVWAANDHRYFFLRFETGAEVQGDEQQSLRLYLDTDMNAGTGVSFAGIGADLVWDFGQREGDFRGSPVRHPDVGLLLAPTVSATDFEIALRLDARPAGGSALFPGSQVRFVLRDASGGGDLVPDAGAVTVTIEAAAADDPAIPLAKIDPDHLRVAAFNVENNGLFEGGSRQSAFTRILNAIDADVWVLNELWDHGAAETASRVESLLPAGSGLSWDAVKRDSGNVVVSRYPIVDSWEILPGSRLTGALIDLPSPDTPDVLVIAAHFSCCTADFQRQEQADALVAFVRDAQTPGGDIDLPADTPIVAAGDFNLVGWRQQLETILSGDIQNEGAFGPDHAPDWDGSAFDLPLSTHTDQRVAHTWRNDFSSFYPGILDFAFVTGSVVDLGRDYVLDTRTMRVDRLATFGLQADDSERASDHNPRVLDLVLTPATDAPVAPREASLRVAPNPFNPRTTISFSTAREGTVTLDLLDLSGRKVRTLLDGRRARGEHAIGWDGRDDAGMRVASGVYTVRLRTSDGVETRKVTLVE